MRKPLPTEANGVGSPATRYVGERAVVLGGSISGLLAARVLSDFYRRVLIVDRDALNVDGSARRGVPQGTHAHVLQPRGAETLNELFPGILAELRKAGVPVPSRLHQFHLSFQGHLLSQEAAAGDIPFYGASRPFLESIVRRRVTALQNVSVLEQHDVISLQTDESGARVTGARVACTAAPGGQTVFDADLVVAATGRSGRVGAWLQQLGYPKPREQELKVDVAYASRRLRLAAGSTGEVRGVLVGPAPDRPFGIGAFAQEGDHWMVTLAGFGGHHPPAEEAAWLDFAAQVAPPYFLNALRGARPLDEIHTYRFPSNLRRRYDKVQTFPSGLLVVGDAICSFNPIYGQGMTVAALEALALRDTLRAGVDNLTRRFFNAAAKPIGTAWQFASGADLAMPADVVPGARSLPKRLLNAYIDGYQAAAEHDPVLAMHFLKVNGFDEPARTLFAPGSVSRLTRQGLQSLQRRSNGGADARVPATREDSLA